MAMRPAGLARRLKTALRAGTFKDWVDDTGGQGKFPTPLSTTALRTLCTAKPNGVCARGRGGDLTSRLAAVRRGHRASARSPLPRGDRRHDGRGSASDVHPGRRRAQYVQPPKGTPIQPPNLAIIVPKFHTTDFSRPQISPSACAPRRARRWRA